MADDPAAAPSSPGATAPAGRPASDVGRRRLALVGGVILVIGALALFTVGRVWGAGRSGYLVARDVDAPLLWPVVAALGALVLWTVHQATRGRTALDVLGWVLVPVVALTVTRFAWFTGTTEHAQRFPSADGSHTLAIESVASILDPEWEVRLESGHGLTKRFRVVGCVNGDWSNVERAQWLSPTTAKIVHSSGASSSDEIATTLTFSNDPDGHIDMSGHGLDSCTSGADSSAP